MDEFGIPFLKKSMGIFGVERDNTLKDGLGVLSNCVDASIRCRIFLVYYLSPRIGCFSKRETKYNATNSISAGNKSI